MSENRKDALPLGDIIGQTRQRLDADDPTQLLKSLVSATAPAPAPQSSAVRPQLPGNYFPQISTELTVTPKRKPVRGPSRSLHISMRLSPPERDRLVRWCDDRNLSLPDGIIALLDMVEGEGERS